MRRRLCLVALCAWLIPTPTVADGFAASVIVKHPSGDYYLLYKADLYRRVGLESDAWTRVGQRVIDAAFDPANPQVVYVVTTGNALSKTMDGGNKWMHLANAGAAVTSLAAFTSPPHDLLVGTRAGLLRSTDGGFGFAPTTFTGAVEQIVTVAGNRDQIAVLSDGAVHISRDGGKVWANVSAAMPPVSYRGAGRTLRTRPPRTSWLAAGGAGTWLAANTESGFLVSRDAGATWIVPLKELGQSVHSASASGDGLLVGSESRVATTTDGQRWQVRPLTSATGVIRGLQLIEEDVLIAVSDHKEYPQPVLQAIRPNGDVVPLNYGVLPHSVVSSVWRSVIDGKPRLFVHTRNNNFIDVFHNSVVLWVSDDDARSWRRVDGAPGAAQLHLSPYDPREMWLGNARTLDGGLTWRAFGMPWNAGNSSLFSMEFGAAGTNVRYFCLGVNEIALYRVEVGAEMGPPTKLSADCGYNRGAEVRLNSKNPQKLITSYLQTSTDGGWTWTQKSGALKGILTDGIGANPPQFVGIDGDEILAFVPKVYAMGGQPDSLFLSSPDWGGTWKLASVFKNTYAKVLYHSRDGSDLLVATHGYKNRTVSVQRSTDKGTSWQTIREVPMPEKDSPNYYRPAFEAFPVSPTEVFLSTGLGLHRTRDGGRTWSVVGALR